MSGRDYVAIGDLLPLVLAQIAAAMRAANRSSASHMGEARHAER